MNNFFRIFMCAVTFIGVSAITANAADVKKISIANFGSHPQLNAVVEGFRSAVDAGGVNVEYTVDHVNFDATLLAQMFSKIQASDPDLIVSITTPVAQNMLNLFAGSGKPMLFGAVTDPVAAELVPSWDAGGDNITGVADAMDIKATLEFMRSLFPKARTVGVPYNPAEANDVAILKQFETHAPEVGLKVASVGIDNTNDIMARVTSLAARSDIIYGPTSNLIQPAIAAVASAATQAGKPVVNTDERPVSDGLVTAGFTLGYHRIGEMLGEMAVQVLNGKSPRDMATRKPAFDDHIMAISRSAMESLGAPIPDGFADCKCIVD